MNIGDTVIITDRESKYFERTGKIELIYPEGVVGKEKVYRIELTHVLKGLYKKDQIDLLFPGWG